VDFERKVVMVVRRVGRRYRSEARSGGILRSQVMKGFWLKVEWLWQKELPDPTECLETMMQEA
jgi:hypothetical protein